METDKEADTESELSTESSEADGDDNRIQAAVTEVNTDENESPRSLSREELDGMNPIRKGDLLHINRNAW